MREKSRFRRASREERETNPFVRAADWQKLAQLRDAKTGFVHETKRQYRWWMRLTDGGENACIPLLFIGAALASCTTAAPQPHADAQAQQEYESLLAGKVAGEPMSCLPPIGPTTWSRSTTDDRLQGRQQRSMSPYAGRLREPACGQLCAGDQELRRSGLCRGDIARWSTHRPALRSAAARSATSCPTQRRGA